MLESVQKPLNKMLEWFAKRVALSGSQGPSAEDHDQQLVRRTRSQGPSAEDYDQQLVRRTRSGLVRGALDNGTQAFLGIPFAQPPLGDLRWRAPRDPYAWDGVRDATRLLTENLCTQPGGYFGLPDPLTFDKIIGTEDCLYLNVWRPDTKESKLPVLFWIHGGSNLKGAATEKLYRGENLARTANCIVVTTNYRVGSLGWFYNDILNDGTLEDSSGNYATLDLIKALQWVRNNIENFGGDPGCVTIAGQSAGGINAWGLMQAPLAKGMFHRAIICSGLPNSYPLEIGQAQSNQVIDNLLIEYGRAKNCDEAAAYRRSTGPAKMREFLRGEVKAESIARHSPSPVIANHFSDGLVVSKFGLAAIFAGDYSKVPLIIGTTKEESTYFLGTLAGFFKPNTAELWHMINDEPASKLHPTDILKEGLYGLFESVTEVVSLEISITIDNICRLIDVFQGNIYRYSFDWNHEPAPWDTVMGAMHGIDLAFLFGNFPAPDFTAFAWSDANKAERQVLSENFIKYVASFMRTGNPNTGSQGLPQWKAWSNWRYHNHIAFGADKVCTKCSHWNYLRLAQHYLRMDDATRKLVPLLRESLCLDVEMPARRMPWRSRIDDTTKRATHMVRHALNLSLTTDTSRPGQEAPSPPGAGRTSSGDPSSSPTISS